jgi:hypothetical protein
MLVILSSILKIPLGVPIDLSSIPIFLSNLATDLSTTAPMPSHTVQNGIILSPTISMEMGPPVSNLLAATRQTH